MEQVFTSDETNNQLTCDVCAQALHPGSEITVVCERCGKFHNLRPKSALLCFVFSLTALILYIPANIFPFMTMELYGTTTSSTILGGVASLYESGSIFIAAVVLLASVVVPLAKLVVLFYLSMTAHNDSNQKFKTRLYHFVEAIGRWSMLDIFLLAILVAMIKLGHWTHVEPELGSVLFTLVVVFTLLASVNFDPKLIWEDVDETRS